MAAVVDGVGHVKKSKMYSSKREGQVFPLLFYCNELELEG